MEKGIYANGKGKHSGSVKESEFPYSNVRGRSLMSCILCYQDRESKYQFFKGDIFSILFWIEVNAWDLIKE
jgi:hypothetical protein